MWVFKKLFTFFKCAVPLGPFVSYNEKKVLLIWPPEFHAQLRTNIKTFLQATLAALFFPPCSKKVSHTSLHGKVARLKVYARLINCNIFMKQKISVKNDTK
jgi:hypothetical protein